MLTILFSMTVKPGREDEFAALAREMMRGTHAEDDGCITYTIHRRGDDLRQFVLYEQWRDREAVQAHLDRMFAALGRERIMDFLEKTEAVSLTPIE